MSSGSSTTSSSARSDRVLVRLVIGHFSYHHPTNGPPLPEHHTHRWTVFVRAPGAANGINFTDRSFIDKVTFHLHPTFENPQRIVKKPPFEVTETGYGGFPMRIEVRFAGVKKTYMISYDLSLSLDAYSIHTIEQILEVRNPPKSFAEVAEKYSKKKKTSDASMSSTSSMFQQKVEKPPAVKPPKIKMKVPKPEIKESELFAPDPNDFIPNVKEQETSPPSIVNGKISPPKPSERPHDPAQDEIYQQLFGPGPASNDRTEKSEKKSKKEKKHKDKDRDRPTDTDDDHHREKKKKKEKKREKDRERSRAPEKKEKKREKSEKRDKERSDRPEKHENTQKFSQMVADAPKADIKLERLKEEASSRSGTPLSSPGASNSESKPKLSVKISFKKLNPDDHKAPKVAIKQEKGEKEEKSREKHEKPQERSQEKSEKPKERNEKQKEKAERLSEKHEKFEISKSDQTGMPQKLKEPSISPPSLPLNEKIPERPREKPEKQKERHERTSGKQEKPKEKAERSSEKLEKHLMLKNDHAVMPQKPKEPSISPPSLPSHHLPSIPSTSSTSSISPPLANLSKNHHMNQASYQRPESPLDRRKRALVEDEKNRASSMSPSVEKKIPRIASNFVPATTIETSTVTSLQSEPTISSPKHEVEEHELNHDMDIGKNGSRTSSRPSSSANFNFEQLDMRLEPPLSPINSRNLDSRLSNYEEHVEEMKAVVKMEEEKVWNEQDMAIIKRLEKRLSKLKDPSKLYRCAEMLIDHNPEKISISDEGKLECTLTELPMDMINKLIHVCHRNDEV